MELTDERESEREAHSITICNMLLKCADISNPAREWALCERLVWDDGMPGSPLYLWKPIK